MTNTKRNFKSVVVILLASLIVLPFSGCKKEEDKKPNIIIFFTDDQGYADVGCYGAEGFKTPNLDKIAGEGIRFTDFYVPATVCTPSRAGLLTGKYPKRVNLHEAVLFPFSDGGLSPKEYTMAEMLKDNGYETACIGKWHLGHKEEYMPNNQGFDYFFGVPYSNDMDNHYYKHVDFQSPPLPLLRNTKLIESGPDQDYLTKRYTDETVKIIKNKEDKPLFIYLAHNMPHYPLHASKRFRGKSNKGLWGDVMMELDWSTGEIMKALKETGEYENTIFIFTSDNGPRKSPKGGLLGSTGPLRGQKAETWDGGQRVPGIISWPKVIKSGVVCNQMVNTMDLMPTLANITGAKLPKGFITDGTDITNLFTNPTSYKVPEKPLYFYARNGDAEAVRLGKWKLHIKKSRGWNKKKNGEFPVSLYNLDTDVSEKIDVAEQNPDVVKKLTKMIEDFDKGIIPVK